MQAVILAGGLGTRLRPLTESVPKPMVLVNGRPFLEYELALLKNGGVDDFVVCVGHLHRHIEAHFGDGRKFGVAMRYTHDGERPLGPAGALKKAEPLLDDEFFVTYGDVYLRAPYKEMMQKVLTSGRKAVMGAYRNDNRHGRSDLRVRHGVIVAYDKSGGPGMRWINYGVTAMRRRALEEVPTGREVGEEEFYGDLIRRGELLAFPIGRRPYEIGTPESLADFTKFVARRRAVPPVRRSG